MSKGSNRRPSALPQETVDERWERTFGAKTSEARSLPATKGHSLPKGWHGVQSVGRAEAS